MSGPRPEARQVRTQLACRGSAALSIAWLGRLFQSEFCRPFPVGRVNGALICLHFRSSTFLIRHLLPMHRCHKAGTKCPEPLKEEDQERIRCEARELRYPGDGLFQRS